MLLGTWDVALDSNGRIALPPSFFAVATNGITITRGFDRCLHAFPLNSWERLADRLAALPLGAEPARHVRRLIFGAAASLTPDEAGTLTLPRPLLAYAELGTAAVVIGMDSYFEIWSPELWRSHADQLSAAVSSWHGSNLPAALAAI